ncbi:MAG TPA: hypothetical protein VMP01_17305 [Pirellulaceae bacterium]|nr:hypothetical protein [Pirellulaceae bacterium]
MKTWQLLVIGGLAVAVLVPGCWLAKNMLFFGEPLPYDIIELTDYKPPPPPSDQLTDDQLRDDQAPKFDPDLVHSEPIDGWQINLSAAVVKLDVEMSRPDTEKYHLDLSPSFAAAARFTLPSVNLIDGKAKQFDDGLYAALDRAYYRGLTSTLRSHVELVKDIAEKVGPKSPAAAYLAAGLELADVQIEVGDMSAKSRWRQEFDASETLSKPTGFYTWNDELKQCFRFLRFFQQELPLRPDPRRPHADGVMLAVAEALDGDSALKGDYDQMLAFYARLTNPPPTTTVLLSAGPAALQTAVSAAFLPSSTSRENELFLRLFPMGLPADADLMQQLIRAVRSGNVDLGPSAESGWYEYQAYALETLLLPERGEESFKLLRTARYKRRMLEAFAALITKRRETHIRQMDVASAAAEAPPPPLENVSPRLRLEPAPTYYLRTARAYDFLRDFLHERVGRDELAKLHGLTAGGERPLDLAAELDQMRTLFFGCYLLSCEDLGMRPSTTSEETGDPNSAMAAAEKWLSEIKTDPDLAADTRVIVPVYYDPQRQVMSVWATVGVRLVKLKAEFDPRFLPSVRPADGGEWKPVEQGKLKPTTSLIAVDEFITCQIPSLTPLSREEFRKLCDEHKTKEQIIAALQARR